MTYTAIFSFYMPEENQYDDCRLKIDADNRYEALQKAWDHFEQYHDNYICEVSAQDIKLCGLQWQGNPLDIQDYFDAQSDSCKCEINRIRNIDLENCRLSPELHERRYAEFQNDLYSEHACRQLIDSMAKDLYAHHGMIPPSVHTELYYAQEMANSLYAKGEYDLGERLSQEIWDAGQWKSGSICNITNLFREQSLYHNGRHHDLSEHFTRDGCYPTATTQTIHYTLPEQTLEMGGIS